MPLLVELFLEVDCHHLLEDGVVVLVVSKVDMVRVGGVGPCWLNGSMLIKSRVDTSRE